jgi:hypothetical protein
MVPRFHLVILACALVLFPGVNPADADEIFVTVTSGFIDLHQDSSWEGVLALEGDHGFSMIAFPQMGSYDSIQNCNEKGCAPGSLVDIGLFRIGSDLPGHFSFDGGGGLLGNDPDQASAGVLVRGSTVLPPLRPVRAKVRTPFDLGGEVFYEPEPGIGEVLGFGGRGTATLFLERHRDFENAWNVTRVRYRIHQSASPVPEPATVLLVGGGLAALAARARKRR